MSQEVVGAYDVVVVGAGPAGSTAARFAALGGARSLLIERKRRVGIPVQCGEFLPTLNELSRIFPRAGELETLFPDLEDSVRAETENLRIFSPAGRGYDIPFEGLILDRDCFDLGLARAAERAGAEVWTGTRVTALEGRTLVTDRGSVRADVVVGADGPRSLVARHAGFAQCGGQAFGLQYLVRGPVADPETVEMYFGDAAPGGYAWVIPKGKDLANVGVGIRPPSGGASARRALDKFAGERYGSRALAKGKLRVSAGWIPVDGPRRETVRGGVMLVGDAAGQLMACNGGGVPTAVICGSIAGQLAASHVRSGVQLSRYERLWRRTCGVELGRARTTRRVFDLVSRSAAATELAMRVAGTGGIHSLLTCQPWYAAALTGQRSSAVRTVPVAAR